MLEGFKEFMENELRLSENSINSYYSDVKLYEKYYKESFVCCDIKESMHYIDKLPLSVLVIPGEKIEDVEYILDMEDVDALVDFFWKEFEHIL